MRWSVQTQSEPRFRETNLFTESAGRIEIKLGCKSFATQSYFKY